MNRVIDLLKRIFGILAMMETTLYLFILLLVVETIETFYEGLVQFFRNLIHFFVG